MLVTRRIHDDVIIWILFPRYWPFVRGIHLSPVNSPHKGQWRGALMFSLICAWINAWVNNREAGDLIHHCAFYDVIVMLDFMLRSLWNLSGSSVAETPAKFQSGWKIRSIEIAPSQNLATKRLMWCISNWTSDNCGWNYIPIPTISLPKPVFCKLANNAALYRHETVLTYLFRLRFDSGALWRVNKCTPHQECSGVMKYVMRNSISGLALWKLTAIQRRYGTMGDNCLLSD